MTRSAGFLLALMLPVVPGFGGLVLVRPAGSAGEGLAVGAGVVAHRAVGAVAAGADTAPDGGPGASPAVRPTPSAAGDPVADIGRPAAASDSAAVDSGSAAQDPEAIAQRADQALAALESLRASFVQEVNNPLLEKTTIGRGTLLYKAPDRFRITYSDPAGDVIVHDGARVWIYLPSSQPGQVIRQPAAASGVQNPLTYLRDLRGQYVVRYGGAEAIVGRRADRLDLQPRERAAFSRVEVWVDRETSLLRRVRTRTEDGVITSYTFQALERNPRLDEGAFRFSPPRGVEIFDS